MFTCGQSGRDAQLNLAHGVRSFVCYCGQGSSLLWTPALRPLWRSNAPAKGIQEFWNELFASETMHMILPIAAYQRDESLASSRQQVVKSVSLITNWVAQKKLIQCQPWPALLQRLTTRLTLLQCLLPSQWAQPHLFASASHVGATDILTLLIKASATVTVYRGHRRALLPARDYLPVHHVHRNHYK